MVEENVFFHEFLIEVSHAHHLLYEKGFGEMYILDSRWSIKNIYKYATQTKLNLKVNN